MSSKSARQGTFPNEQLFPPPFGVFGVRGSFSKTSGCFPSKPSLFTGLSEVYRSVGSLYHFFELTFAFPTTCLLSPQNSPIKIPLLPSGKPLNKRGKTNKNNSICGMTTCGVRQTVVLTDGLSKSARVKYCRHVTRVRRQSGNR